MANGHILKSQTSLIRPLVRNLENYDACASFDPLVTVLTGFQCNFEVLEQLKTRDILMSRLFVDLVMPLLTNE